MTKASATSPKYRKFQNDNHGKFPYKVRSKNVNIQMV